MGRVVPILRILDVAKAKEFYGDFLGFQIDWEHRFGPDLPLYAQISREGAVLHLSEHFGDVRSARTFGSRRRSSPPTKRCFWRRSTGTRDQECASKNGASDRWRSPTRSGTSLPSMKRCRKKTVSGRGSRHDPAKTQREARPRHGRKSIRGVLSKEVAGQVAELADALDLGSSGATRQSSSLCLPIALRANGRVRAEVAQW